MTDDRGRRRGRGRRRSNGKFKAITIDEACAMGHVSRAFFYNHIKPHVQTKRLGRRLLVNEYAMERFIKELPDADR